MGDNWIAIDCETTGLDPSRHDPWEIALVWPNGHEALYCPGPPALHAADPGALRTTGFYQRIHAVGWEWDNSLDTAHRLVVDTAGRHLVGAVPSFDAAMLEVFLREHELTPAWHYHLIDVEAMAVGFLHGWLDADDERFPDLPWRSDDLSRLCGVDPPADDERHTALGDARWAWRWYRHLTGQDEAHGEAADG